MKTNTLLLIVVCIFIVFFSNCGENIKTESITGVAQITKDGFYINDYVRVF